MSGTYPNPPGSEDVLVVADAGPDAGLGHLARCSAIATGLRARGLRCRCVAFGSDRTPHSGWLWEPVTRQSDLPRSEPPLLLLDTYNLDAASVRAWIRPGSMAVMHDLGPLPQDADLVVTSDPRLLHGHSRVVGGPALSCLGSSFWGLPVQTDVPRRIGRVLVTTGGGDPGGHAVPIALTVRSALPRAEVILVRGPGASFADPDSIRVLDRPESLFRALRDVDLSVTSAGTSLLEALAIGTPALALLVAENQRAKAASLASQGATQLFSPDELRELRAAISELDANPALRLERVQRGHEAVDGYGALRVAFLLWSLIADGANGER